MSRSCCRIARNSSGPSGASASSAPSRFRSTPRRAENCCDTSSPSRIRLRRGLRRARRPRGGGAGRSIAVRAFCTLGGGGTRLTRLRPDVASILRASPAPRRKSPTATRCCASDPQYIMYTSGTTGPSKGVVSPHSQALGVGRSLAHNFGYRPDDVIFTCLPLFHGNALWYSCYAALWADCALAVSPRFSAAASGTRSGRPAPPSSTSLGAMTNILLEAEPLPRGPRAPRAAGHGHAVVAGNLSRGIRTLRRRGHFALRDDRDFCRDDVHAGRSRSRRAPRPAGRADWRKFRSS